VKIFTDVEAEAEQDLVIDETTPGNRDVQYMPDGTPLPVMPDAVATPAIGIRASDEVNQFRMDALQTHNEYRSKHNAPPLQYSEDLSMYAQYWAENMAKTNRLVHSPPEWRLKFNNEPLGENVVLTNGFNLTGKGEFLLIDFLKIIYSNCLCLIFKGMSDMWYGESYKHAFLDLQKDTKSFTQMVWINSRMVGFGKAQAADGKWYGCAHYYPEGNIPGQFRNNVLAVGQTF